MHVLGNPGGEFSLLADPSYPDGELVGFLLDHYRVFYQRQTRGMLLARQSSAIHRRPASQMLLYNDTVALSNPLEVVYYFDSQVIPEQRLIPLNPTEASTLANHWKLYYHTFNAAVNAWLYAHLIPQKTALLEAFNRHASLPEQWLSPLSFGWIASRLSKRHKLTAGRAEEVLGVIRKGYERIDKQLQDTEGFIIGDRLSLADILFAVMAAPTVLPEQFDGPNPQGAQIPPKMLQIVKELRERPAGKLVLRLYAQRRHSGEH